MIGQHDGLQGQNSKAVIGGRSEKANYLDPTGATKRLLKSDLPLRLRNRLCL